MEEFRSAVALGLNLIREGRYSEAEDAYERILRDEPENPDVLCLLGSVRLALGKTEAALADLSHALRLRPSYPEALNNLAIGLTRSGRPVEAEKILRSALCARPDDAEAHNNLGSVLRDLGRLEEAESSFREAIRLRPEYAEAQMNLGVALADRGELRDALRHHEEALRLRPGHAFSHVNMGNTCRDLGEFDRAEASYEAALRAAPDLPEAHFNRGLNDLLRGHFGRGWRGYEWRDRCRAFPRRSFDRPRWDGSPLEGRTILLHPEQGFGDLFQFLRYATILDAQGGRVILECPGRLRPLLGRTPGIDGLVGNGEAPPPHDVQAPLMSLPHILAGRGEEIPARVPYVFPDPALVARWKAELSGVPGLKVGVCWQGNPRYAQDRARSFRLEDLGPVAEVPDVRLVGLQKGGGSEQVEQSGGRFPILDLGPRLDESGGAFMDTAAVMCCLDLVIAPNTALAHLAGSLGVPSWVALPASLDWRWMAGRSDSPWYPTARLYRRREGHGWGPVFQAMADDLQAVAAARKRPIFIRVGPGELLDRITILRIKGERLADPAQRAHVRAQLDALPSPDASDGLRSPAIAALSIELRAVNERIWDSEEAIRACERAHDFGPRFVELARSVYADNDRRASLKREVDRRLGSPHSEEKSHLDRI